MNIFKKNLRIVLCSLSLVFLAAGGCIDIDNPAVEVEDVTNKEPYSKFIGTRYRLNENCYLAKSKYDYYIYRCGYNGAPREFSEKYIGTAMGDDPITNILPKGTEFTIIKIKLIYSNGGIICICAFVEIGETKIVANADLIAGNISDSAIIWADGCAELVEPVKK